MVFIDVLRLTPDQTKALAGAGYRAFEEKTLLFLRRTYPRRSREMDDAALRAYIREMTRFAADHDVKSGNGVQKLMVVHIDHAFPRPLPAYLAQRLRGPGFSEHERLHRFIAALTAGEPPRAVTLKDDLPRIRAEIEAANAR
ncbi:hypothetical protein IV417_03340 [Alphaproteobacteria bacterium KMM 3653]|uniref:Uncharacterized protein n=1 Tax=Harenicola maris TaxID=2841044 RepID=A0AAP2CM76_9RHOB|nr:hypothetical protein [Harenicola maris]